MVPVKAQLLRAPPPLPNIHVSESDQPASLREHEDVNVPPELLPDVGTLLAAFHDYVASKGYACFREPKLDGGNHITDWWLRVTIDERAPERSVVQYGETVFDGVNPVPHLWVRSKAPFRHESYALLKGFLQKARLRRLALIEEQPPQTSYGPGQDAQYQEGWVCYYHPGTLLPWYWNAVTEEHFDPRTSQKWTRYASGEATWLWNERANLWFWHKDASVDGN